MNYSQDNPQGGRPPLFTQDRASRVLEAVRRGLTYRQSASYAGISYSTLNRWRLEGKDLDDDSEICQFWKALQEANGEAAFCLLGHVNDAAENGDWRAAGWILERRFPRDYGRAAANEQDVEEQQFPNLGF